jgi:hypothetical protein
MLLGVNDFSYVTEVRFTQGDVVNIYFQLVDKNKDDGLKPPYRRYMPASAATLVVTIKNINDSATLTKTATQPFTQDPSIWRISLTAADSVSGTFSLQLALTEGSVVTRGTIFNAISSQPQSGIMC